MTFVIVTCQGVLAELVLMEILIRVAYNLTLWINMQQMHVHECRVNFDLYESLVAKYDFTSSKLHHVGRRFTCPDVLDRDNVRFEGKQNQMLTGECHITVIIAILV